MLSLPGIRSILRSRESRNRHEGGASTATLEPTAPPPGGAGSAYVAWLAAYLDLDLLAVIKATGNSAEIEAASKSGFTSELTLPRMDEGGPLARLAAAGKAVNGRARIFTTGEVFPRDGNWCDFVPLDSATAFAFVPVDALPVPAETPRNRNALPAAYVVGADLVASEAGHVLEVKTSLAASLLALADSPGPQPAAESIPGWLNRLLTDEGYTIAAASGQAITVVAGRSDWTTGPQDLSEIHEEIRALEGSLEPGMAPVEITPQDRAGRKMTVYPAEGGGPECLLVVKAAPETNDTQSRREWLNLLGRFTASIAHEIKNPLTGIAAGVQYLAKRLQPGAVEADTVDFILAEIARLNRIVDDLYKIARPPQRVLTKTSINSVITKSLFCLSEEVVRKRLQVDQDLQSDVPAFDADPERLQQVLINVIKNAIEASKEAGAVEVSSHSGNGVVTVTVTDHGPGIPAGERARIFEPFVSTKKGGTGLGLYISQAIVEEHGGTINVDAAPGGGARFTIRLPATGGAEA